MEQTFADKLTFVGSPINAAMISSWAQLLLAIVQRREEKAAEAGISLVSEGAPGIIEASRKGVDSTQAALTTTQPCTRGPRHG